MKTKRTGFPLHSYKEAVEYIKSDFVRIGKGTPTWPKMVRYYLTAHHFRYLVWLRLASNGGGISITSAA